MLAKIASGALRRFFAAAPQQQYPAQILELSRWPVAAYAVGDVHGCFDLYRDLEARLEADAAALGGVGVLVVLGDFVDRGPQSAQMLDHLSGPHPRHLMRIVLRGNHEEMFARFLAAPDPNADWLRHGGVETLASYGIDIAALQSGALSRRKLSQMLETLVPPAHRAFLRGLPDALILAPFMFVHAGVDATLSPREQPGDVLRWGRGVRFSALDGSAFPLTVAHGHTPCADGKALIEKERVNLDTGAYASGCLSAARFMKDGTITVFVQEKSKAARRNR